MSLSYGAKIGVTEDCILWKCLAWYERLKCVWIQLQMLRDKRDFSHYSIYCKQYIYYFFWDALKSPTLNYDLLLQCDFQSNLNLFETVHDGRIYGIIIELPSCVLF